jgi:hypothetical protein
MDEIYFGRLVDTTEQKQFKEDSIAFPDYGMTASKSETGMGIALHEVKETKTDAGISMSHKKTEMVIPEKLARGFLTSALESFVRFYLPKGKYEILITKKE